MTCRTGSVIAGVLAALAVSGATAAPAEPSRSAGNQLVWADEFDGTELDPSKWSVMLGNGHLYGIPGWGNNELQYYRETNATVADGHLTITAREEPFAGYDYTSARLRTLGKGDFTYGRIEMRAMLPTGQGIWPAFWMLYSSPTYGGWAASGEIDIMESVGSDPDHILGTIHYGGPSPENVYSGSAISLQPGTVTSGFHEYAIEWEEGEIRWYFDGQLYATRNNWYSTGGPYPAPFNQDFHLLLNVAVGGNLPGNPDATTVFPQHYVIDYVRVYELAATQSTSDLVFDTLEHGNPFGNGWFEFGGSVGGGGMNTNAGDVPPGVGGDFSLETGWGSGGVPGFFGGFGRNNPINIDDQAGFSFWINPDAGQDYTLEINLQDDDNGDGNITQASDDEFQYLCVVSATGPCAISGGGWQRVEIPLNQFTDDNSFLFGGNGVLDADAAGNGALISVVVAVIGNSGTDVSFRTDQWIFTGQPQADTDADGVADSIDNCLNEANADQRDTDADGIGNRCDPDLNNDCEVNFADLAAIKAVFLSNDPDADFSGDGDVNFGDLAILKSRFLLSPGPSGCPNICDGN